MGFLSIFTPCKSTMTDDMSGFGRSRALDPEDFYYNEDGYIVFTEAYHKKRGYCCKSGCKHCPYGFDKKTGMIRK